MKQLLGRIFRERYKPLKALFTGNSLVWGFGSTNFTWLQCVFYWLKTLICLICNWKQKEDTYLDQIQMLAYDSYVSHDYDGPSHRWSELAIGEGVFTRWYYNIYENADR
jgi:hypothetical protein